LLSILKSKIHRATVTEARVDYIGSITIDSNLMEEAGILPYEKVLVASIDSGSRLETYVIEGKRDSGIICLNGAAAKIIQKGEKIIIMAFGLLDESEAKNFIPKIIHVDENNKIIKNIIFLPQDEEC
jgi:aspartate 1-decarboxylase